MWQEEWSRIIRIIEEFEPQMIEMQRELTKRPAIGPENGGIGEEEKAEYLREFLGQYQFPVIEIRAPDNRVPSGFRPNLIVKFPGTIPESGTIWIMSHLDIVPPGPENLWRTPPFEATVQNGKIYGRGVEDNQQSIVASIFALISIAKLGLKPSNSLGLLLVADEETGSKYGIEYLLTHQEPPGLVFKKDDIFLVPDAGTKDGMLIEIGEKSIIWLKFKVIGKQSHASTPQQGRNALRAGAYLITHLDKFFHRKYRRLNRLFRPQFSTFEPTKKEANVPNINTIPGEDIFYFDCRLLPEYELTDFLLALKSEIKRVSKELGVEVSLETIYEAPAAPITDPKSPVIKMLKRAIYEVYKKRARVSGIGGGTVAAFLRRKGFSAAVYSKVLETAHQPNEHILIKNMINDCKVFAHIFGQRIN